MLRDVSDYIKILIIFILLIIPVIALAESPNICGSEREFHKQLSKKHKEQIIMWGKSVGSHNMRIYVNREKPSWTIVIIGQGGRACLLDTGKEFELLKPVFGIGS